MTIYTYVASNDPAGGVQRIQSYTEFQIYVGDPVPWRPWADTAFRLSNSGDA